MGCYGCVQGKGWADGERGIWASGGKLPVHLGTPGNALIRDSPWQRDAAFGACWFFRWLWHWAAVARFGPSATGAPKAYTPAPWNGCKWPTAWTHIGAS